MGDDVKKKTAEQRALDDARLMYHRLELAAALKHPVMGKALANTLKDTDPRMFRMLDGLNNLLENSK